MCPRNLRWPYADVGWNEARRDVEKKRRGENDRVPNLVLCDRVRAPNFIQSRLRFVMVSHFEGRRMRRVERMGLFSVHVSRNPLSSVIRCDGDKVTVDPVSHAVNITRVFTFIFNSQYALHSFSFLKGDSERVRVLNVQITARHC